MAPIQNITFQVEDGRLREQIEQYNRQLQEFEDRQRQYREERERQAEAEAEVVHSLLDLNAPAQGQGHSGQGHSGQGNSGQGHSGQGHSGQGHASAAQGRMPTPQGGNSRRDSPEGGGGAVGGML